MTGKAEGLKRRELFQQAAATVAAAGLLEGRAAATGACPTCSSATAGPAPARTATGQSITARAFGSDGSPAADVHLSSLLLVNAAGRPFELLPRITGAGTADTDIPPREKFEIMMTLLVRDFGTVYLYADNAGALYSDAVLPRGRELILNFEFASSRAAYVRRYVKAAQAEGMALSPGLRARLERGEAALAKAEKATQVKERVAYSNDSLAETMWAGEVAALERARQRIARQGPRPGFLFGCNAFGYAGSEEYARRFASLLNYATVPFYRASTERTEGSPDFHQVEAILEKLAGTGILAKGHPLVWFHSAGIPGFLKAKSWEELKRSCDDYIQRSVARFRTRIHTWDVINEAHDWANDLNLDAGQLVEITRLASESTRKADPTAFRVVNNCCTWGEYAARRRTYSGPLNRPSRTPLDYITAIEEARVPYEAIGLQIYYPGRDMLEIERQLERFFVFGKPVHITELGVSSSSEPLPAQENSRPSADVWHGAAWNETIQADWVEQFYTICYSKPEIQAITWWDFSDPAFIPHGGMLSPAFEPKESYRRLAKLLGAWRTGR